MRVKSRNRYEVSGLLEAQFEPGSRGRVPKNLLGITRQAEMDRVEAGRLKQAVDKLIRECDPRHQFTAVDICRMH